MMTSKERIFNQLEGNPVDRIPLVGGWALSAKNMCNWADVTYDEYRNKPEECVLQAYANLRCDGLFPPAIPDPEDLNQIRTGKIQESEFEGVEAEDILADAEKIPDTEEDILKHRFSPAAAQEEVWKLYDDQLKRTHGFTLIPINWWNSADFILYARYGYEAYLEAIALYPEAVEKLYWESAVIARRMNEYHIQMIKKNDLPKMMLSGHDICNNMGPMCSPKFLKEHYWPHAKYALKPLVDAGIRLIHHCDGNVMPIIDDMIDAGYTGFQGFQYECGVDPYELAKRRGPNGETMLFLAGLSVTRTLPFGTVQDVKDEVEFCMDYTAGGKGLFLFTSNVVGVEVPPENLRAGYKHAASINPAEWNSKQRPWPWSQHKS